MRRPWLIALGGGTALTALCWFCSWGLMEQPRFEYTFDVGHGRTVRVWSQRGADWLEAPNPLWVTYRIDQNGAVMVPETVMDTDDGGQYQFNLLSADDGKLVCVYETNRSIADSYLIILYDASSGESWPRDENNHRFDPEIKAKWCERFERVRHEHPTFQIPANLRR